MVERYKLKPFLIQDFSIDATTSSSGKIIFNNLNPSNAMLLLGAINPGYNNVCLIFVYTNGN